MPHSLRVTGRRTRLTCTAITAVAASKQCRARESREPDAGCAKQPTTVERTRPIVAFVESIHGAPSGA